MSRLIFKNYFFWLLVALLFALTRIVNLKIIPIFTDEAIYAYWAQVALFDPQHRFISLEDGKQPLFIWFAAVMQKFFSDPLIALRMVSVLSGAGSLIGLYLLSNFLFNKRTARIAVLLYLVIPLTLLYNRLGIYDSLLTMFGIFAVYLTLKVAKNPDLGNALLNGFAIGFAMITKSSGNFFLYLIPASILLIERKKLIKKVPKWTFLSLITVFLSLSIYNSLRLSPLFYLIARKNMEFIRTTSEVLKNPFEHFFSNLNAIIGWLIIYMSPPLFILFLSSAAYVLYKKNLKGIYLLLLISAPLLAELLFNKVLYVRFVLFYFPFIIILTAFISDLLIQKIKIPDKIKIFIFALILIWPSINSFLLITKPASAQLPKNDSDQYLNNWPAGYGVEETVQFLKSESKDELIYVATEGTFGLFPYALNIYFYKQPNIEIRAFWPLNPEDIPTQIYDMAEENKTYVIFNQTQKEVINPRLEFISSFQKGVGESHLRIYKVI